jgi:flagellum-specific peptidoglycan hydrolase FlgJ
MATLTEQINFVKTYWPIAVKAGAKYGLEPISVLSQAAIESAWGTSYGARHRNNYHGIISAGSPNAYWDGSKSQSSASGLWFRIYKSPLDGFMDHSRLISSKYPTATKVSKDTVKYAQAIAQSPYISEKNGDDREGYRRGIISAYNFILPKLKELGLKKKQ